MPDQRKIKIDHVYFINLDDRQDRLNHMESQLSACPWPHSRISAIRLESEPEKIGLKMVPSLQGRRSVASIWLSHQKALEEALNHGGTDSFIILEDDVHIGQAYWKKAFTLPQSLPKNWDMILLSPKYRSRNKDLEGQEKRKKFIRAPVGQSPVLMKGAMKEYICTGAHFFVFRSRLIIERILKKMKGTQKLYHVDRFYMRETKSYGIYFPEIWAGGLGSDHEKRAPIKRQHT